MMNNYGIGHDGTPKLTTHLHYIGLHMNLHKAQKPIKPKKRGHGGAIQKKKTGACDALEINASVEGQN